MVEFAGPEVFSLEELAVIDMRSRQDEREVVPDPLGTYFGAHLASRDLLPEATATIAPTRYHDWRIQTHGAVCAARAIINSFLFTRRQGNLSLGCNPQPLRSG
jgi:hypothetical protein